MTDKQNAARVAWTTIELTQVDQRPVSVDQLPYRVHAGRRPGRGGQGLQRRHAPAGPGARLPVGSFHTEARRLVDRPEATPPATPTP
jgi:hypothetical protein